MCLWPYIGSRIGKQNWRRESNFLAWTASVSIQGHACLLKAAQTGRTCISSFHQHYCMLHAVSLKCKEQYEIVGLLRSSGNGFFMFMTHLISSWFGICVSTIFSSLVVSKSVWLHWYKVGLVREVQRKCEWLVWIPEACFRNILSKITQDEHTSLNLISALNCRKSSVGLGS